MRRFIKAKVVCEWFPAVKLVRNCDFQECICCKSIINLKNEGCGRIVIVPQILNARKTMRIYLVFCLDCFTLFLKGSGKQKKAKEV